MTDQTQVLPPEPTPPVTRRRTRGLVAVVASVAVVVAVAAGGFAAWQALSGAGPRPAEVLPDSVFALVSIDLDPAGGQKLEAIRTLREFPAFRDRVGLEPESDPMRWIFEKAQDEGTCTELDYDRDVKSWIGQRAGIGGALLDGGAVPVAALQVSDTDNARAGFRRLAECAGLADDGDFGWTLAGEYLVLSDSTVHAESLAAQGEKRPLAEDADYQRWTEEAGGPGIMNAYLGPSSLDALAEQLGDSGEGGSLADGLAAYRDFQGAAAVLRFADRGIELSLAGSGGKATQGSTTVGDHVAQLPADTAFLLALAVPPGALGGPHRLRQRLPAPRRHPRPRPPRGPADAARVVDQPQRGGHATSRPRLGVRAWGHLDGGPGAWRRRGDRGSRGPAGALQRHLAGRPEGDAALRRRQGRPGQHARLRRAAPRRRRARPGQGLRGVRARGRPGAGAVLRRPRRRLGTGPGGRCTH